MCGGTAAPRGAGWRAGPGLPAEGRRFPARARQAGLATALTEAAGETVHLAGKAPGSGLSGAGTSFSGPTKWPPLSLTRLLSRSPGAPPGLRLRGSSVRPRRVSQPRPLEPLEVESRAAQPPARPPSQAAAASAAPRPRARARAQR